MTANIASLAVYEARNNKQISCNYSHKNSGDSKTETGRVHRVGDNEYKGITRGRLTHYRHKGTRYPKAGTSVELPQAELQLSAIKIRVNKD